MAVDELPHIRRLPGGAIDYDFYRRKAQAQRALAIAEFFMPKKRSLTLLARLRAAWKS
jgi:hypothetical protein